MVYNVGLAWSCFSKTRYCHLVSRRPHNIGQRYGLRPYAPSPLILLNRVARAIRISVGLLSAAWRVNLVVKPPAI